MVYDLDHQARLADFEPRAPSKVFAQLWLGTAKEKRSKQFLQILDDGGASTPVIERYELSNSTWSKIEQV